MTTLWFRNTQSCLAVCAEEGISRLTWTRQHLTRLRTDGILRVRQFYMSTSVRPKIMIVGIQGSAEYSIFDRYDQPEAVYPTWSGKEDRLEDLLKLIQNPVGESQRLCSDLNTPSSLRPVFGQKHRVVLHNCPSSRSGIGKQFWLQMNDIQTAYPDVELFVNGLKGFSTLFGLGFKAVDFGLCDLGDVNQHVILPNGVTVQMERGEVFKFYQWEDWIKALGFTIDQIVKNQQERYRFRIRAAKWGAKYWSQNYRFHREQNNVAPDYEASDAGFKPRESRRIMLRNKLTTIDADKVLCNRCRISPGCKFFRQDSICGLKESKVGDLEKFFQSRNADLIIQGLAQITQMQARRLENTIDAEAASGEVDPDVTKQMSALFNNGVKLAKLVNPDLAGGPKVQVNVGVNGGNAQVVAAVNPKALMADIVNALEAKGIRREDITSEMLEGVLKAMSIDGDQRQAIEGAHAAHEQKKPKKGVINGTVLPVDL